VDRRKFAGLDVVVENPAGSTRYWHDRDGRESGSTLMRHDYGFIDGHVGVDGDELDCYLGPDEAAPFVHVIHQMRAPEYSAHDEDKVMLGFRSEAEARAGYLAHRNDGDRAYGGMSVIPLEAFKRKLQRREGTGKIRHEVTMDAAHTLDYIGIGGGQLFDVVRGGDGRLPVGRWDRGMTPGFKEKEGKPTEFSPRTFGQMIDNWLARGERLSLCYNHQSAYAKENGAPAPALAFYDAAAVVSGGQVVRFDKLLASAAQPPMVAELERYCAKLATEQNPNPSPDGCWWWRCEHTEIGEKLLPGFGYLSPMFVPNGKDERGRAIGYVIFDLAATNTAFQGGCMINFEALTGAADQQAPGAPEERKMKFNVAIAKKHLGLMDSATDAEVKQAFARKMEEAKACLEGDDDAGKFKRFAESSEEMAKHYEDAYAGDDKAEGKEEPHLTMRRFATKFRKLAAEPGEKAAKGGEPDADDAKKMEEGKKAEEQRMERRLVEEYSALAARLQVPVRAGMSSTELKTAINAVSLTASELPGLVEKHTQKILMERDTKLSQVELERRARAMVDALDVPKTRADALYAFAITPGMFDQALETAKAFPLKPQVTPQLFERITVAGAPAHFQGDPRASADPGIGAGPDRRIVENQLATFVVEGEKYSTIMKEWADAKEGPIKAKIDEMLSDDERTHSGYRAIAADKLLRKERPELFQAAEHPQLFSY
jgi:hypothetical protein